MTDEKTNDADPIKKIEQLTKKIELLEKKLSILISALVSKYSAADNLLGKHENNKQVCVVILTLMKAGAVVMQAADEELRIFSSEEKAKAWLQQNDFFWGRRSFLKYDEGVYEWMQQYDRWDKYTNVQVLEVEIDDFDALEW